MPINLSSLNAYLSVNCLLHFGAESFVTKRFGIQDSVSWRNLENPPTPLYRCVVKSSGTLENGLIERDGREFADICIANIARNRFLHCVHNALAWNQ